MAQGDPTGTSDKSIGEKLNDSEKELQKLRGDVQICNKDLQRLRSDIQNSRIASAIGGAALLVGVLALVQIFITNVALALFASVFILLAGALLLIWTWIPDTNLDLEAIQLLRIKASLGLLALATLLAIATMLTNLLATKSTIDYATPASELNCQAKSPASGSSPPQGDVAKGKSGEAHN